MEWCLSENTASNVPCSPPYAYHRLGWIKIARFTGVNPGLGGVDSNMHFYYCPMNRLNQTESAVFSYVLCSVAFKVPFSSFSKCRLQYVGCEQQQYHSLMKKSQYN
jgi:hypothetical protein